jgi:Photosynthetic reaction centre cytochrome C subunit
MARFIALSTRSGSVGAMRATPASMILFLAAAMFGVSVAAAEPERNYAVPPYKNLKVLPKNISRANLLATMKSFSQSLGVSCTYCHVGEDDRPLSAMDFASDKKADKAIARDMLRLVNRLNRRDLPAIGGLIEPRVTCYTCHRGSKEPARSPPTA